MANAIVLPHTFYPRHYQLDTMRAFFKDGIKNFIDIEHRRAGKDDKWLNIMIAASQLRVGTYVHAFPTLSQAKKAIWTGITKEGRRFIDRFPTSLVQSVNNTDLSIKFKNGSIYRLAGSDYYDSWMGTNPVFVAYSEYSLQDPMAAQYFWPILAENNGWQAFFYTPRGRNHGYKLYEKNKDNPTWFCQHLSIEETKRNNGKPVIDIKEIEQIRDSGMSEELIQQEFYCSFDAAIEGAYFAKRLRRAREDGRICVFPIDTAIPVSTYWDLGQRDKTVIWFIQKHPSKTEYFVIGYYENFNQDLNHYINHVYDFRDKHGISYKSHFGPHDSHKRESDNIRIIDKYRRAGLPMEAVPRIGHKSDGIEAARAILGKCWFHEVNCEQGLSALSSYHGKRDDKKGVYGDPVHDWSSHAADAFMQFAQTHGMMGTRDSQIIFNRVGQQSVF